jgi:hypothetical protein
MDRPSEAGAHEQSHGADIFTYLPEQIGMSVAAIPEKAPGANESSTSVPRRVHRQRATHQNTWGNGKNKLQAKY